MFVSGGVDRVPWQKELLKGRFASHQRQRKPEATAVKVNVGTAREIQSEAGVTLQRLRVELPRLPRFEPCCFLPNLQPHHNSQPSYKSISDFFPGLEAVQSQQGTFLPTLPVRSTDMLNSPSSWWLPAQQPHLA